ncbi:MAG: hypothetical protein MZV63_70645 [Marinilabiliales bacterium]|nr:hypothetical protein [Marinilabiliales bacterium]
MVDVTFETAGTEMPNILDALEITRQDGTVLVVECQQHIGEKTVRAIAMDSTDGLQRGMEVVATGLPIIMPVGEQIQGPPDECDRRCPSTVLDRLTRKEVTPSTANRRDMRISQPRRRFFIRVSRSST